MKRLSHLITDHSKPMRYETWRLSWKVLLRYDGYHEKPTWYWLAFLCWIDIFISCQPDFRRRHCPNSPRRICCEIWMFVIVMITLLSSWPSTLILMTYIFQCYLLQPGHVENKRKNLHRYMQELMADREVSPAVAFGCLFICLFVYLFVVCLFLCPLDHPFNLIRMDWLALDRVFVYNCILFGNWISQYALQTCILRHFPWTKSMVHTLLSTWPVTFGVLIFEWIIYCLMLGQQTQGDIHHLANDFHESFSSNLKQLLARRKLRVSQAWQHTFNTHELH